MRDAATGVSLVGRLLAGIYQLRQVGGADSPSTTFAIGAGFTEGVTMGNHAPARLTPTTSRRSARLHCEALEGRVLLTAAAGDPPTAAAFDAASVRAVGPSVGPASGLAQLGFEEHGRVGNDGQVSDTQSPALEEPLGDAAWRDQHWINLTVADLSGDGRDDFIFANSPPGRVSVVVAGTGRGVLADGAPGAFRPSATQLVDLNGDGVLDLAVPGSAGVRLFPGLGGGRFGPEVNGGQGLVTGVGAAQVVFARLGDRANGVPSTAQGDPYLDMIVTSAVSGEVLLFYGAGGWDLEPGQRLPVGPVPTSVLARDVTADGLIDLVVTTGGGSVWVFPGLGGGRFDLAARVLPTGSWPVASYVADFDRDGRADLVTLDYGSDSLTYYSDIASTSSRPRTIGSGGRRPVAALERDIDGDGVSDLIVANHDGRITLFLGSDSGLTLARTVTSLGGHTTALAASSEPDSAWQFYVAGETDGWAALMSFEPELAGRLPASPTDKAGEPHTDQASADADAVTTALFALWEAEVVAAESPFGSELADAASPVDSSVQPLLFVRAALWVSLAYSRGVAEEPGEEGDQAQAEAAIPPEIARFLLGADDAKPPVVGPNGSMEMEVPPAPSGGEAPSGRGAEAPGGQIEERPGREGAEVSGLSPEPRGPYWDTMLLLAVSGLALDVDRRKRHYGRSSPRGVNDGQG
ncbi:MAG: VCBS repeat-containing protein [Gemmataceae bacterium]